MCKKTRLSISALAFSLSFLMHSYSHADTAGLSNPFSANVAGVKAISDDGLLIGGYFKATSSTDYQSFLWGSGSGLTSLGSLGGSSSFMNAFSEDGSIVVGMSSTVSGIRHAYYWTAGTGMVDMGSLGSSSSWLDSSSAVDVSDDGTVIVGTSGCNGCTASHAFRWTAETGMQDLGTLGSDLAIATAISGDGYTIVGYSNLIDYPGYILWPDSFGNQVTAVASTEASAASERAFRWTQESGMVSLGTFGGKSYASDVSYDGAVVVGYSSYGATYATGLNNSRAFRWTQATGMVDLGTLGGVSSQAKVVSDDGAIIYGTSKNGAGADRAFRWTQETGLQDLNSLLSSQGLSMDNYVLTSADAASSSGVYFAGSATVNSVTNQAYIACYDPGENGCVGITTASKQEEAAIDLASNQQIAMAESRSAANELMGFTRPMTMGTQTFSGAMFGSAMGYAGGQYTKDRFTLLGGLGYGAQDYKYIKPENSLTVASGLRYTFDSVTGEQVGIGSVSPFVEAGGWYTPDMEVALSRPYNNGTGTNRGEGNTNSSSWAEYVKAGLVWDQSEVNQFTAYGELGRQHMLFDGYSETATSTNPFPATISDSEMTFNFARAGGSWTRQLDRFMGRPVSFTVAGAVAHSFGVKTNLTSTVSGVGTAHAVAKKNLWAEYGGRLSSDLTDTIALNLDLTGTTGNNGMGTAIHGGAGVSLKF